MGPMLASAGDLTQWANSLNAQGLLPKLVRRLILATTENATRIDMRSEEGIRYAGFDGIVEAGEGNLFVPAGVSAWEMGVNQDPKAKAESDFTKRTENPLDIDPTQTAFVFVTPRRWAGKNDWAEEKSRLGKWRGIQVFDADDLETWLERAPGVHVWISRQLGKYPGDVRSLDLFWADWQEATLPPISTALITAGRQKEMTKIEDHLQGPPAILTVRADAQDESLAFIAATLERSDKGERDAIYARTLIVDSIQAWRQIVLTEQPLVLLPTFRSDEIIQAVRHRHHVLIPVGREIAEAKDMVTLPRLPRQAAEEALQAMGFNQSRAAALAPLAQRSLHSLQRTLSPYPEIHQPVWASTDKARDILPAMLAGKWDETVPGDQDALSILAGHSYQEFSEQLARYANESDPPVRQTGSVWTIVSKEDAWRLLSRFLTRHDMEQLRRVILDIFGTLDPALELPTEKRWMANALEKSRPHSKYLREGLADTITLMAVRSQVEILGGTYSGEYHATGIVLRLLHQGNEDVSGQLWTSLSDVLPSLAEAAPDVFLNTVETASEGESPIICKLFTDKTGNTFEVRSAHTALLWALERLAWSPDYLSNVALALARLTRLDSGGRLTNRPGSSLRGIFVPWHPQTSATFEERMQVLDMLREQEPDVSWKLMLSLLPQPGEIGDSANAPQWRNWKPEEQDSSYTYAELWKAVDELITRLLTDAGSESRHIGDIIERIGNLPPPLRATVCDYLESLDPSIFDTNGREIIYTQLRKLISEHQRFSTAAWAMPTSDVDRLKAIYERFTPENSTQQALSLFSTNPQLLDGPEGIDIKLYEEAIYQAQVTAAKQIYQDEGFAGLFRLIKAVELPDMLGLVLGKSGIVETEDAQLLNELGSSETKYRQSAMGYVAGRFFIYGWQWADEKLKENAIHWLPQQQADFFLSLPANSETWDRLEGFGDEAMKHYWTQTYQYVEKAADCLRAVKHLLHYGRVWQAVDLLAPYVDMVKPEPGFVMDVLEATLATPIDNFNQSLLYGISQIFTYLEHTEDIDEKRLGQIEWTLLPVFRYEKRPMKILHSLIATDPEFFVDIVSRAYRARGEEPRELNEQERDLAQKSYDILHSANHIPGTRQDGTIDATVLTVWVSEARLRLKECKRLEIGDQCIGRILQHAKHDENEVWPPLVIRDLLEKLRSDDIELGLQVAERNTRGATWRNFASGGEQERVLSAHYLAQAEKVRLKWPRSAAMLRRIAIEYASEAQMWDNEAKRWEDS